MGKDVLNDAIPTVEFTVEKKGTYTIAARIPACATATCFYGIQLFKAR